MSPVERLRTRFYDKVRKAGADECWPWMAQVNENGYGKFKLRKYTSPAYAHRLALVLDGRAIPDGMMVHHTCHNRRCVNPKHLRVVTYSYNKREMHWWGGDPKTLLLPV